MTSEGDIPFGKVPPSAEVREEDWRRDLRENPPLRGCQGIMIGVVLGAIVIFIGVVVIWRLKN
jgi:hypothetical protein